MLVTELAFKNFRILGHKLLLIQFFNKTYAKQEKYKEQFDFLISALPKLDEKRDLNKGNLK